MLLLRQRHPIFWSEQRPVHLRFYSRHAVYKSEIVNIPWAPEHFCFEAATNLWRYQRECVRKPACSNT